MSYNSSVTFRGYFLVSSRATFSDILAKAHDERVATRPAHWPRAEVSKARSARRLNRRIDRKPSYRRLISAIRGSSFVAARASRQTRGPARPLLGREIAVVALGAFREHANRVVGPYRSIPS